MKFSVTGASIAVALAFAFSAAEAATCSPVYGQCGGIGFTGPKCCASGSTCVAHPGNKYYSQCLPGNNNNNGGGKKTITSKKHTTTKKKSSKATTTTTKKATKTKTSPIKSTTKSASTSGYSVIKGGASGVSTITRYWDCCKVSCGWNGKASVTSPVDTCAKNGISIIDDNIQSGCVGGGAGYTCNNNQPWAVNENLSYGFAAASIVGNTKSSWCCSCMELTFTSGPVIGKKMVVQITNTGDDEGLDRTKNAFDLHIPGGGVGYYNGCSSQWGAPSEGWGIRYGGVSSISECSQLPSQLQPGCKWRFTWFKGADNPTMSFKQVTCPKEIVARTGCERK